MKVYFILISLLIYSLLFSQAQRETRAVWVSTNYRLDWPPPTNDENLQKKELIEILDNIERKNLNTLYFQVRSNGTVLFRSSQEIFSPYITGQIGQFGEYDPLEFAVEEAHKRGLEIHAVVNTMRVFSGNEILVKSNSLHISQIHPEWVYTNLDDNSIWLDPGLPEVRYYLVELINEIVQNYNVDGIQLDFIRYPNTAIRDQNSYREYGNGETISNWRRDNITSFIHLLNDKIKTTNPKIKLGVTPIGIYKSIPNGHGMEGFSDVFQDSRKWLELGIIDYAVPQIYWDTKANPKFDLLAKDWIENSFDRNIIVGIGAYKPEVNNEIEREINITRKLQASGMAFFRYSNIKRKKIYSFNEKVLPSEMPWLEVKPELTKLSLSDSTNGNNITLNFSIDGNMKSDNGYFAIYENHELIKVIPNYLSKISFSILQPDKIIYSYSATQFDQLWSKTSHLSNNTRVPIDELLEIENSIKVFHNPILLQNGNTSTLLIYCNLDEEISLYGNTNKNQNSLISKHFIKNGYNEINLNYNLKNFKNVTIHFLKENKTVTL